MRRRTVRTVGGAAVACATAALLRRMRLDFERDHRLRPSTTVAVYAGYGIQLGAMSRLMVDPTIKLVLPREPLRVTGGILVAGGIGTFLAAVSDFGSLGQLSGAETGQLAQGGIYRVTRNPQYLGYLIALAGASIAARSVDAVLLTVASAAVFDHWIRHEEANLLTVFGEDYRRYRVSTSRWIATPSHRQLAGPA